MTATKSHICTASISQWICSLVQNGRSERRSVTKKMQLLETLSLGGRKHLMLVRCASDWLLVGCSGDSIESIVRIQGEQPQDGISKGNR
jgi:flagellar biogenesis protein FliO